MKKTKLEKNIKWFLNNYITIIMLPATFLILFISIYGRIIFENSVPENGQVSVDWKDLKTFVKFFDYQMELSSVKVTDLKLENEISKTYNHIFVVDRTLSNSIDTSNFRKFANFKYNRLKKSFPNIEKLKYIKDFFILEAYEKFINNNNKFNFINILYDGNNQFVDSIMLTTTNKVIHWVDFKNNDLDKRELYFNNVVSQFLKSGFSDIPNHKTYFTEIINEVKKLNNRENSILTIISDFCSEGDMICNTDIQNLQKGKFVPIQVNLVYITPNKYEDKIKSEALVNRLIKKIHGSQLLIPIYTETYSDNVYNTDVINELELDYRQCMSSIKERNEKIVLYYPNDGKKQFRTADCLLNFTSESNDDIYFRLFTPYPQDNKIICANYKTTSNKQSNICVQDGWELLPKNDSLVLQFPINSNIHSEQFNLDVIQGNVLNRFCIRFQEHIPYEIANISSMLIWIIVCLFILLVFIFSIGHLFYYEKLKDKIKLTSTISRIHERSKYYHNIILIAFSSVIAGYFLIINFNWVVSILLILLFLFQLANFLLWNKAYRILTKKLR